METHQEKVKQDLIRYQTGIKQLYTRHYQVYLFSLLAIMLLTVVGIGVFSIVLRILMIGLLLAESALAIYLFRYLKAESFETYFKKISTQLPPRFSEMQRLQVEEDAQSYFFSQPGMDSIKINKKNARNFPSQISEYTLLVGFTPNLSRVSIETPLYFYYYEVTQIKKKRE